MNSDQSKRGTDRLPTPCPECGTTLENRDDAIVHLISHMGDGDV